MSEETSNANMADLSVGPGLVAWKRGYWRVSFWLQVLAIESIDTVSFGCFPPWSYKVIERNIDWENKTYTAEEMSTTYWRMKTFDQ